MKDLYKYGFNEVNGQSLKIKKGKGKTTMSNPSAITTMFNNLDLTAPMTDIVAGVTGQVTDLIPIGIGIILVMAVPRIVSRIINAFV